VSPGVSPGGRRLAWVSLVLLALLLVTVVVMLVASEGLLVLLAAGLVICVVVVAATAWWAFTTYRPWKRRLNIVVGTVTAAGAVLAVARFSVSFVGGVVAAGVLTVAYAETARRALAAAGLVEPGPHEDGPWPSRPWLLVNAASGGGKATRLGLLEEARGRGMEVHVLQRGEDPRALAMAAVAAGADAVGVAGGDGSLRAVAGVAVETGLPFLCVPTGTRNHFAADLGLDRAKPVVALDAVNAAVGRLGRVDVGLVNGGMFLNNVSLGAYADLVRESTYRDNKLGTAHAVLPKTFRLERAPLQVAFRTPDGQACDDAVLLFVANNPHSRSPFESGARTSLDSGQLQVTVLRARTGVEIAAVLAQVARRGGAGGPTWAQPTWAQPTRAQPTRAQPTWAQWTTPALRVESAHNEIPAGIDGESVVLATPLEFGISPRALRVLLPSAPRRRRTAELLEPFRWNTAARLWAVARGRDAAR